MKTPGPLTRPPRADRPYTSIAPRWTIDLRTGTVDRLVAA